MSAPVSSTSARLDAFKQVGNDRRLRSAFIAFAGFSIGEYGTWVTVLVYAMSVGDATTVGIVAVIQLVPAAILAAPLARWLDRFTRGGAATVAYATQAVALGATAAAMFAGMPPPIVIAIATCASVAVTLGRPAHNSLVPELTADTAHLTAANVVTTAAETTGVFAGPALVGAVMAFGTPAAALAVLVGVLTLAAVAASTVPRRRFATPGPSTARDTVTDSTPLNAAAPFVIIGSSQQVIIGALDVLVVVLAIQELGIGDAGAGFLNAALGFGGVVGGIAASALVGRHRLLPAMAFGIFVKTLGLALIPVVPLAGFLLASVGAGHGVVDVANRTLLQRSVPLEALGRMFGVLEAGVMGSLAIGSLVAPILTSLTSATRAAAIIGLVAPAALLATWGPLKRADSRAEVPQAHLRVVRATPIFAALQPSAIEALARGGNFEEIENGHTLVAEGDLGDRMWMIDRGSLIVSRKGKTIAHLGPGDVVGEIALVSDVPRIATVTAETGCRLLSIDRSTFLDALAASPATRSSFEAMADSRRVQTLGE